MNVLVTCSNALARRCRAAAPRQRCPPPGFTLVETIVVILVIAVLISLTLPALGRAREAARRTKCLSQLSSLSQIVAAYGSQNNRFPLLERVSNASNPDSRTPVLVTGDRSTGFIPAILRCPSDDAQQPDLSSYEFIPGGIFAQPFDPPDFVPPDDSYGETFPRDMWMYDETARARGGIAIWIDRLPWHAPASRRQAIIETIGSSEGRNVGEIDGSSHPFRPR